MTLPTDRRIHKSVFNTTLLVVGFGYVIDAFDLFLYNSLRVPSLRDLGLDGDALVKTGLNILNIQVVGMLIGGFIWGILGDKIGRKKALVGSVFFYSIGSLGCCFVTTVPLYALARFLTGIGLAGEMGLGAILVTETLPDDKRSWGVGIFTLCAYLGITLATVAAGFFSWRICYAIGGATGLIILLGRMILFESGLYEELLRKTQVKRGSIKALFGKPALLRRWLCTIFFMMPYFYIYNLLITLAPEFSKAVGLTTAIKASSALMVYSLCAFIGTMLCVVVSNLFKKRIGAIAVFMALNMALGAYYLFQRTTDETAFYVLCAIMGAANYFVLQLFAAIEQFGTNMRATAGTSSISIGRTTLVLTNALFLSFKSAGFDIIHAGAYTGAIAFTVGFACLFGLRETWHQGMDFIEDV